MLKKLCKGNIYLDDESPINMGTPSKVCLQSQSLHVIFKYANISSLGSCTKVHFQLRCKYNTPNGSGDGCVYSQPKTGCFLHMKKHPKKKERTSLTSFRDRAGLDRYSYPIPFFECLQTIVISII
jgi:hypothetical protein